MPVTKKGEQEKKQAGLNKGKGRLMEGRGAEDRSPWRSTVEAERKKTRCRFVVGSKWRGSVQKTPGNPQTGPSGIVGIFKVRVLRETDTAKKKKKRKGQ